jgi:hypothetical protein
MNTFPISTLKRDNGALIYCTYNIARLSVLQYIWQFELPPSRLWRKLVVEPAKGIVEILPLLLSTLSTLVIWLTFPISVPVILLLRARIAINKARGETERMTR